MKYGNLHLHSTYSDAQFTPEQLVLIGKSLGYCALALTDHETDGGVKEFQKACEKLGMDSLFGVEFYGTHDGHCPHLVALDFDMDDPGAAWNVCADGSTEADMPYDAGDLFDEPDTPTPQTPSGFSRREGNPFSRPEAKKKDAQPDDPFDDPF